MRKRRLNRREFVKWGGGVGALTCFGCTGELLPLLDPRTQSVGDGTSLKLLARIAHLTDSHIVDEESPARFPGAYQFNDFAWRPYESYASQLFDGIVRAVNRIHAAGRPIDFLLHTGDGVDNAQGNEVGWLLDIFDGRELLPRSGPDDRDPADLPPTLLDPHAAFTPQGLYVFSRHGSAPSIPWYQVFGNHDIYGLGVFPIFADEAGHRTAPLPFPARPGWLLPVTLDPTASLAYGHVTPANPGPPELFQTPQPIVPVAERAYLSQSHYAADLRATSTAPSGHGCGLGGATWYSLSPAAGVQLISLDTTDSTLRFPGSLNDEGAISRRQFEWLEQELALAEQRGDVVIIASHHPSEALQPLTGSETTAAALRSLLSACPNVVLHLAGHRHRNRVVQHESYVEIETCSTLDLPQEGRLVELWQDTDTGELLVGYEMFGHLDNELPALGDDPLRPLREQAWALAAGDKSATQRQRERDPSGHPPAGYPNDRTGTVRMTRI